MLTKNNNMSKAEHKAKLDMYENKSDNAEL